MKTEFIPGENGYEIPCLDDLIPGGKAAVIISHGFGSSKESPTAAAVSKALGEHGMGAVQFDFPAHGESPVNGEHLRMETCLNDLAAVEAYARARMPGAEIAYFSSSFGAYVNLIYLSTRKHAGEKSFLRCAAVDMPGIIRRGTTREQYEALDQNGFVMMDEGYNRPLKLTRGFYDDLAACDVFRLYRPGTAELMMIHGTEDETASIGDARRFAKKSGAAFIQVEGADHRFLIPGGMNRVVDAAVRFFSAA